MRDKIAELQRLRGDLLKQDKQPGARGGGGQDDAEKQRLRDKIAELQRLLDDLLSHSNKTFGDNAKLHEDGSKFDKGMKDVLKYLEDGDLQKLRDKLEELQKLYDDLMKK